MLEEIRDRGIDQEIIDEILRYVNENGANSHLYGNWHIEDGAVAFLWYLVVGPSYRQVYMKSKIPRSNLSQHFGVIRKLLKPWANSKITGETAEERVRQANAEIDDPQFANISGYIDATDFCVVPLELSKEEKKNLGSWKFKHKAAYKYLFHMLPNGMFAFVGPWSGGRPHDIKVLERDSLMWKRSTHIMPNEQIMADKGFVGWQNIEAFNDIQFFVPFKRQGGPLMPEQLDYNTRHSALRGKIERGFGWLKGHCHVLHKTFYGPPRRHEEIVRICTAMHNMHKMIEARAANLHINNLLR